MEPRGEASGRKRKPASGTEGGLRARLSGWRGDAAIAGGISLLAILLLLLRTDLKTRGTAAFKDPGWDRHLYIEMARRDLLDFQLAPYCWRLLVPWLAKLSPFGLQPSFMAITLVTLAGAGVALFLLLREAGFGRIHAALGVGLFFSLGWGAKFVVADFWVPDSTVFLFVTVAMLLALRDKPLAFALVLALGVTAKESVLFVGPLFYTLHARQLVDWRRAKTTLLVVLPAVAVVVVVRLLVPAENGDASYLRDMPPEISRFPELFPEYDYRDLFRTITREQRWTHRTWTDLDRYFTDALGVLPLLLAVLGGIRRPGLALRLAPFILLAYTQLLFATDTQRLIVLSAPAVIWLGLHGAELLRERAAMDPRLLAIPVVLVFALTLSKPDAFDRALWLDGALTAMGLALAFALSRMSWMRARQSGR